MSISFKITPKLRAITVHDKDTIDGYYVYELQSNEVPFYVGAGKLRRAFNLHNLETEDCKRFYPDVRVVIVKDNLTKGQALDLRRSLIFKYTQDKMYLSNVRNPFND